MRDRRSPDPADFLPLTHLSTYLLLVLADAPGYGYALVQRIRERSDDLVNPGAGSFYSIVRKLVDQGLVAETDRTGGPGVGRVYEITPLGRAVLAAEATRLSALASETRRILRRPEPHGGRR